MAGVCCFLCALWPRTSEEDEVSNWEGDRDFHHRVLCIGPSRPSSPVPLRQLAVLWQGRRFLEAPFATRAQASRSGQPAGTASPCAVSTLLWGESSGILPGTSPILQSRRNPGEPQDPLGQKVWLPGERLHPDEDDVGTPVVCARSPDPETEALGHLHSQQQTP